MLICYCISFSENNFGGVRIFIFSIWNVINVLFGDYVKFTFIFLILFRFLVSVGVMFFVIEVLFLVRKLYV